MNATIKYLYCLFIVLLSSIQSGFAACPTNWESLTYTKSSVTSSTCIYVCTTDCGPITSSFSVASSVCSDSYVGTLISLDSLEKLAVFKALLSSKGNLEWWSGWSLSYTSASSYTVTDVKTSATFSNTDISTAGISSGVMAAANSYVTFAVVSGVVSIKGKF